MCLPGIYFPTCGRIRGNTHTSEIYLNIDTGKNSNQLLIQNRLLFVYFHPNKCQTKEFYTGSLVVVPVGDLQTIFTG